MARNEYAHLRLTLWALWCARNRGGGQFASASVAERVDGAGWDAPTVIRNLDAEADETDKAVSAQADEMRKALTAFYQGGGTVEKKAARLGVSPSTLYLRVEQGTHAVARWLEDRQRAAEAERERVEALQRQAVNKGAALEPAVGAARRQTADPGVPADRTGSTLGTHLAAIRAARKAAGLT